MSGATQRVLGLGPSQGHWLPIPLRVSPGFSPDSLDRVTMRTITDRGRSCSAEALPSGAMRTAADAAVVTACVGAHGVTGLTHSDSFVSYGDRVGTLLTSWEA